MIHARTVQRPDDVARHYDELDRFYREVWGEHVHHGLWTTGRETADEATVALVEHMAGLLGVGRGARLVDIGCGYGASARLLAGRYGAEVTGLTLSAAQAAHARGAEARRTGGGAERGGAGGVAAASAGSSGAAAGSGGAADGSGGAASAGSGGAADGTVTVLQRDWLANGLPDAGFDAAYAIESSEHMADKDGFFREAARVLKPGGRLGVYAWLAREGANRVEIAALLEPICREGRLPSMGTTGEYRAMAERAGLRLVAEEELGARVRRTWWLCARTLAARLVTDPSYARALADRTLGNRVFALTLVRILVAYHTGSMRYGLFVWEKPAA